MNNDYDQPNSKKYASEYGLIMFYETQNIEKIRKRD
jgi:hypothetical protein